MSSLSRGVSAASIGLLLTGLCASAQAAWNSSPTGRVTRIEASDSARFQLDQTVGTCSWLYMDYSGAVGLFSNDAKAKVESAKQLLLAAFLSGKRVQVFADSATCRVEYLHLAP